MPNYLGAAVISPDGAAPGCRPSRTTSSAAALRDGLQPGLPEHACARSARASTWRPGRRPGRAHRPRQLRPGQRRGRSTRAASTCSSRLETSRQVAVVDAVGRREMLRFDAGRAPQGLAMSADGLRLFVNNFMDRSVGVFDLTRLVQLRRARRASAGARWRRWPPKGSARRCCNGKQLFYDARDTAPGARPLHELRVLPQRRRARRPRVGPDRLRRRPAQHHQPARPRRRQGFLHWSNNFDEVQDFEGQIRTLAGGTGLMTDAQFTTGTRSQPLGDRKAGCRADLDALAAYVASLNTFDAEPAPAERHGTLSADAAPAQAVFADANCAALPRRQRRSPTAARTRCPTSARSSQQRQAAGRGADGHRRADPARRVGHRAVPARRLGGDAGSRGARAQQRRRSTDANWPTWWPT